MPIKLNAATGGGSVSLSAPNSTTSNADVTLTLPPNDGDASQYLQTDGSGGLSWQTVASLSNAEDGTGTNFEFNSGFGSNGVAYGVRAWINFDGSSASIGTGRASGNMDAVTDNGTGDYTVNFTTDMPDTNYVAFGASGTNGTTASSGRSFQPNKTSPAVGSFRFSIRTTSAADINDVLVYVCIVR